MAAEGYMRGVINPVPCDNCTRGVEPHTRGLPVYPECVSVPVEADADIDDPDTQWLMRGTCMNCYHRSYTNCSCRKFLRSRVVSKLIRIQEPIGVTSSATRQFQGLSEVVGLLSRRSLVPASSRPSSWRGLQVLALLRLYNGLVIPAVRRLL